VQLHGGLRDAAARLGLELGTPLLLVASLFNGHQCSMNLDTWRGRVYFRWTALFDEKE
jgi:hypothetical protein